MAGLLHCSSHHALVFRARTGLAAWADLALFSYIFAEQIGLLVIDDQQLVCAKLAKLGLGKEPAVTAAFTTARITTFVTHGLLQKN